MKTVVCALGFVFLASGYYELWYHKPYVGLAILIIALLLFIGCIPRRK